MWCTCSILIMQRAIGARQKFLIITKYKSQATILRVNQETYYFKNFKKILIFLIVV